MNPDPPFIPVVYEHAARLIGRSPWEVSRSAPLMAAAHVAAARAYSLDRIVLGIDIYNVEPESYGASVADAGPGSVPVVTDHPLDAVADLAVVSTPDWPTAGRIPLLLEAADLVRDQLPEVEVAIPVNGAFSLASNLIGFEQLLMGLLDDPEGLRLGLERLQEGQEALVETLASRGCGVTCFDSAATPPLLPPSLFGDLVAPLLGALVARSVAVLGAAPAVIIGGDTLPILPALLTTGAGAVICPAETDQEAFMAVMAYHPRVAVRVNLPPEVFTAGDRVALDGALQQARELAARHPLGSVGSGVLPHGADPGLVASLV